MSENNELFKDITEKPPFYKNTKFWASALLLIIGLALILLFYKTVIQDTMSDKEVATSIQVVWHDSIWVDKKVRPDEATIVPSFTFKIKNTGSRPLQYVGFNCIFIFEESGENLTDGYVEAVKDPLPPGQVSDEIFVKGFFGYRATSKPAFIKNMANWKAVKVKIYAKTKNSGQVLLGSFPDRKKRSRASRSSTRDRNRAVDDTRLGVANPMKKLPQKVFVVLAIFFIAVTAIQFWQRQILFGKRLQPFLLNTLLLLAAMLLLFLFLLLALLRPLARRHEGMFLPRPAATAPQRRPLFFPELGRAYADAGKMIAQLQEQIGAGRKAQGSLEALMRTSQSLVVTMDHRLRPTFINEFGLARFQVAREAVAAQRAGDFFERKFIREVAAELKEKEQVVDKETTMTLKTGEKIDIALSLSRLRDTQGRPNGYLAVISDISKRRKAEIDLKNQILFSRQIFQSIPEMIIIVDRRLRITFFNKRAHDLIQSGGASVIGQNLNAILSQESPSRAASTNWCANVWRPATASTASTPLNPVLEEENYVDLIVEPLKSGNIIIGGIILLRDISEWRGLTAQLRSLQGFMQKLINASPYAVISINSNNLITTWNSVGREDPGRSVRRRFRQEPLYPAAPVQQVQGHHQRDHDPEKDHLSQ